MSETLKTIPVNLIDPADDNLRQSYDGIEDLAASIEFVGLIEPIRLTKDGDRYKILAGHRRFEAIVSLGWEEVKALVQSGKAEDSDRTAVMLIENMQRVDLDVREEAEGVRRLMQEHGFTQKEVADSLGVTAEWVKDRVAILNVDDVFFTQEHDLPISHLALIGRLDDARRERLAKKAEEDPKYGVGQYQVEEAWNKAKSEEAGEKLLRKLRKDNYLATTEKELKRIMKAEVTDLDGTDLLIKQVIGAAEKITESYWEKFDVPVVKLTHCHGKSWVEDLGRNELVVAQKKGGYVQWAKAEVTMPNVKDEGQTDEEAEINRVMARNDELRADHRADCKRAEVAFVENTKPAELVSRTLMLIVNSLASGYQSFARLYEVLDRLDLPREEFDKDAAIEAQRDAHSVNVETLVKYASKNGANLARAATTVNMVTSFGNPYDVEYPAEPEYEDFPDEEYEEEFATPLETGV